MLENNKKIGFLLFEKWHNKKHLGSSRIRGHWLIKNWPEAELYVQSGKYDVIIFQKCYWPEYVKAYKGIKILDVCDPDWLDEVPFKEMLDNCDAITTSSEALRDGIKKFAENKPVVYIPDRQDLSFHNVRKQHKDKAKRVIWFGYSHNANVLDRVISTLKKHDLKLTVLSCCRPPYSKADNNIKYEWDNPDFDFNKIMIEHDFVIMPDNPTPRGMYKSKNKTYTAWALNLPVASNRDDLIRFLDPEERRKEAEKRFKEVVEKYDVKQSVLDFKKLIKQINANKNENKRKDNNFGQ